eukprot:1830104-Rhodomonas_salina.1
MQRWPTNLSLSLTTLRLCSIAHPQEFLRQYPVVPRWRHATVIIRVRMSILIKSEEDSDSSESAGDLHASASPMLFPLASDPNAAAAASEP